jgi:hypothetical protein
MAPLGEIDRYPFREMDFEEVSGSFDAIVARLVLMYLSDPAD